MVIVMCGDAVESGDGLVMSWWFGECVRGVV